MKQKSKIEDGNPNLTMEAKRTPKSLGIKSFSFDMLDDLMVKINTRISAVIRKLQSAEK